MKVGKPDLARGIYRVTHTMLVGSARLICESDLIFLEGRPFVVLEWAGPSENQYPGLTLPLDPAGLGGSTQDGRFVYNGRPELVDPRIRH
jgi:hypothetical protein